MRVRVRQDERLGLEIDEARANLPADIFTAWLSQVDGSGAVRPRYEWAPGKDIAPPVPMHRLSAEWADAAWVYGSAPDGLTGAGSLMPILERSLEGDPPTAAEIEELNIGHALVADAVLVGLEAAVRAMKDAIAAALRERETP